jgi:branched-chain amino acid transport system permease protein
MQTLRKNRTLYITLAVLILLFVLAIRGMSTGDWVITMLRGIAVGAVTFLVASGLSLIFGLLDVLSLAHGALFMIGAYIGWTVYVRPDTFIDLLPPIMLLLAGLLLRPLWGKFVDGLKVPSRGQPGLCALSARAAPWVMLFLVILVVVVAFAAWPIAKWDQTVAATSPATNALMLDQTTKAGQPRLPFEPAARGSVWALLAFFGGGFLLSLVVSGLSHLRGEPAAPVRWQTFVGPLVLLLIGLLAYLGNDGITAWLMALHTTWMFLIAIAMAVITGAALGGLIEVGLIRPLYARPIYQLMLTLGVGVVGIELVRAIWGKTEFTMPKPAIFQGAGEACPSTSLSGWLTNHCSTFELLGARLRTYNEVFIIMVGVVVLIAVWLLLKRSRLGMIIRAGVQDSQMVEALGINVRRIFTLVFALGAGLAALGGVVAGPAVGLSPVMGESYLLVALITLAIGGLTSFPGAAAASLLVGLLQQFIIKYGQIGINLPFTDAVFKPSPPLVPASTVLLMVVILLLLPQGLFGRKE